MIFFLACECKLEASVDGTCDINGRCSCKEHVAGDKCEKCVDGYSNWPKCDKCAVEYHGYPDCKSINLYYIQIHI